MERYKERVAVVTGTSRGIGRMIATHFLNESASVVGLDLGASTIEHDRYSHLSLDIGDDNQVRQVFQKIARQFPSLDILVNNAAVLTSQHLLLMPGSKARDMVSTNILGTVFASREAAKLMSRKKYGRIINIGSMAASLEPIGDSVYAATKTAAMTLAGILAKEFAPFNITINTLGITAFPTGMLEQLPKDKVGAVVAALPLARFATEDDILNVLDFFASERSSYVTAQRVFLGGVH
jgi:3-oxoacyl-[acyl-carrier protein] reductase